MGITLLKEFTSPKKALADFLSVGKRKVLTFSTRLGSAIMKSCEMYQPKNKILLLAHSHFITFIFAP